MLSSRVRPWLGRAAIAAGVALALVWGVWLVAVPSSLITSKVEAALSGAGMGVEFRGFRKGLFYSVHSEGLTLKSGGAEVLYLEGAGAWLRLSSLLMLKPAVDLRAGLAGGAIEGKAERGRAGYSALSLRGSGIDLSALGLERAATGLRAGGIAGLDVNIVNGSGHAVLSVDDMSFLPYSYIGFSLPLDVLESASGLLRVEGQRLVVESLTIEGRGIFARLSGMVASGRVDLRLELMPSPELEQSQPFFKLIESYRDTAGHYDMPLRTSY